MCLAGSQGGCREKALLQAGSSIPVFAMTQKAEDLVLDQVKITGATSSSPGDAPVWIRFQPQASRVDRRGSFFLLEPFILKIGFLFYKMWSEIVFIPFNTNQRKCNFGYKSD